MSSRKFIRMKLKINRSLFFLFFCLSCSFSVVAQVENVENRDTVLVADSVLTVLSDQAVPVPDSTVQAVLSAADTLPLAKKMPELFKPDPKKAVLYALVPGLGQIYNRKYWKLPLVYGAFMGCMYAITWNNKNYKDYSTAFREVMADYKMVVNNPDYNGPWGSWEDFVPQGQEKEYVMNTNFHDNLKRRKDYYRRYRDLSIIITVGVYAISMIDAYVDAQLFDFDISPDLTMHVEPAVMPQTKYNSSSYGLNCSLRF